MVIFQQQWCSEPKLLPQQLEGQDGHPASKREFVVPKKSKEFLLYK